MNLFFSDKLEDENNYEQKCRQYNLRILRFKLRAAKAEALHQELKLTRL